jgi:hypothetical protein
MTPADRRITELIDKWLASIDLHLKYVELSDAAYARAQAWPKHDRPTRWVLEVARQKVLELKAQCETRVAMGDGKFSESLELMSFLANLVGIQHIQRFIPLADPSRTESATAMSQTVEVVQPRPETQKPRASGDDTTREMPRLKVTAPAPARSPAEAPPQAKRNDGAKAAARAAPPQARPAPTPKAPAPKAPPAADVRGKIIADAIRLLKWGKSWHELPELIERIADRPPAGEIRKVLRASRSEIEEKAAIQN